MGFEQLKPRPLRRGQWTAGVSLRWADEASLQNVREGVATFKVNEATLVGKQ